uniref:Sulfotransferase n=1 Tax=Phallusia mammillata TaxID=59560 RepID=A0A6F9DUJ0_9ASCI|nr:sulfotransferase family cytosolic 1B member 1 [Phallusia mammillata]
METIAQSIPAEHQDVWEGMVNFDFAKAYGKVTTAEVLEVKGHRLQPTFPAEGIEYAMDNWTPKNGDVFVASFPRTGTNWTTEIVRQIIYGRDPEKMKIAKSIPLPLMLLEGGLANKFKIANHIPIPRMVVATHLPATLINVDKFTQANAKFICVVRNPKDQILSWFHFAKKLPYLHLEPIRDLFQCDWEQFFDNYTTGKQPIGLKEGQWYLDHLLTWNEHKQNKNVYFVYFEDIKKDFVGEIHKMSRFLGVDLNDEEAREVAMNCGFGKMQQASADGTSDHDRVRGEIGVLRKGEIGGWKDKFTQAQSDEVDRQVREKLGKTDFRFTFEA